MTTLRPVSIPTLLAALLLSGAAAAADRRPIDERRPLKADARVSVHNIAGLIHVEAWDRNELHLTGFLSDEVEELAITGDAAALAIEVKVPRNTRNVDHTELRLRVPAGIHLDGEAVSADVKVSGIKGDVRAASVSGDVTLDVGSRKVKAESVSGDVDVRAPAASAEVQSVSGDVSVIARGEIRSESVSGDIHVQAREVRELKANTVSGDLRLDVELAKDARLEAETLSGDVVLALPSAPEGRLELESFSGSLRSDFDDLAGAPGGRHRGHDRKRFKRDGAGRGSVELNSHSGDVILKKR